MLARPFILQAEMLARICPRIASLSENIRQKTSSRVDTRLVSVASESDRGSIPLLSYNEPCNNSKSGRGGIIQPPRQ